MHLKWHFDTIATNILVRCTIPGRYSVAVYKRIPGSIRGLKAHLISTGRQRLRQKHSCTLSCALKGQLNNRSSPATFHGLLQASQQAGPTWQSHKLISSKFFHLMFRCYAPIMAF